ncbi:hypothetical protein Pelo_1163 [Pelomyxa schiedti]|nr:hypothetical protein Pelo_1163 [Pelomyxa schiedti]
MKTTFNQRGDTTSHKPPTATKHRRIHRDNAVAELHPPDGLDVVLPPAVLDEIVGMLMWPPHPRVVNRNSNTHQEMQHYGSANTVATAHSDIEKNVSDHGEAFNGIRCLFQFALCSHKCLEACERVSILFDVRATFSTKNHTTSRNGSGLSVAVLQRQLAEMKALYAFAKVNLVRKRWELQVASSHPAEMVYDMGTLLMIPVDDVTAQRLVAFNARLQSVADNHKRDKCSGVVSFVTLDGSKKVFLFCSGAKERMQVGFCVANCDSPILQPPPSRVLTSSDPPPPWIPLAQMKPSKYWEPWLTMHADHYVLLELSPYMNSVAGLADCSCLSLQHCYCFLDLVFLCCGLPPSIALLLHTIPLLPLLPPTPTILPPSITLLHHTIPLLLTTNKPFFHFPPISPPTTLNKNIQHIAINFELHTQPGPSMLPQTTPHPPPPLCVGPRTPRGSFDFREKEKAVMSGNKCLATTFCTLWLRIRRWCDCVHCASLFFCILSVTLAGYGVWALMQRYDPLVTPATCYTLESQVFYYGEKCCAQWNVDITANVTHEDGTTALQVFNGKAALADADAGAWVDCEYAWRDLHDWPVGQNHTCWFNSDEIKIYRTIPDVYGKGQINYAWYHPGDLASASSDFIIGVSFLVLGVLVLLSWWILQKVLL